MKVKIKNLFSIVICLVIFFQMGVFGFGCSNETQKQVVFSERVDSIMFSISWLPNNLTYEDFTKVKEVGADEVILNVYQCGELGSEKCNSIIEMCINNGLQIVPHLRNAGSGAQFTGDDALYSADFSQYLSSIPYIALFDEPQYDQLDTIGSWVSRFEEKYPNTDFFVNLFPEYAGANEFNGHSYAEYVQGYSDKVLSKLSGRKWISTDYYPYLFDESNNTNKAMKISWLYNLELMQKAIQGLDDAHMALDIMTCSMNGYRLPTIKEIRQQVYVGLCYGVEKFGCYTYGKPLGNWYHPDGKISMVDEVTGEPTSIWYAVKEVISEVKKLQSTYLQYQYNGTKTFLAGETFSSSKHNSAFSMLQNQLDSFQDINSVYTTQDTVVSEFFNKDGKYGYVMVNYSDPANNGKDLVKIRFNNCSSATVIIKGEKNTVKTDSNVLTVELDVGEGCMIIPN